MKDTGIWKILQAKYSFPRIQWLIGAISVSSLIYLSSEELWKVFDQQPFPEVSLAGIVSYVIFFLFALISVHYIDTKGIVENKSMAFLASLIAVFVDLSVILLSESIVLYTIQVLPQDYLGVMIVLLIGAMPASLGSIVLSALTGETLKRRARRLYEEVREVSRKLTELEEQRSHAIKDLKGFEERRRVFEGKLEQKEVRRKKRVKKDGE